VVNGRSRLPELARRLERRATPDGLARSPQSESERTGDKHECSSAGTRGPAPSPAQMAGVCHSYHCLTNSHAWQTPPSRGPAPIVGSVVIRPSAPSVPFTPKPLGARGEARRRNSRGVSAGRRGRPLTWLLPPRGCRIPSVQGVGEQALHDGRTSGGVLCGSSLTLANAAGSPPAAMAAFKLRSSSEHSRPGSGDDGGRGWIHRNRNIVWVSAPVDCRKDIR
jgi:hypothetical protein